MNDPFDLDRASARIARNMLWLAATGTLAGWAAAGWRWGAGFLLGAAISMVNYRALKRLVESLGGKVSGHGGFRFLVRFLLLAAVAYVILRFSSINLLAVLLGLFVLIGAVFIEAACEIYYAGKRTLDHQDL